MSIRAVTLDFHNTIARCDRWFALEIRELVPETLQRLVARGLLPPDDARDERARVAYRALRQEIVQHGEEQDALACTMATLGAIGLHLPPKAVAEVIEASMRDALEEATPLPGVIAAVRALRARGLALGVVSSAVHHPFLDWTLARFGIADAFTTVITSASSGYYKSRPEIYQLALHTLGTTAAETLHVGDSYRFDVLGARRAGLRTIWYASAEDAMAQAENKADAVVADLSTLPDVIATLDNEAGGRKRWWQRP